jgi:hypothetical protein
MKITDTISIESVVQLIVSRDFRTGDDRRSAEQRASKRLEYAIKKGWIARRDGGLLLHQVNAWLRKKWPGQFDELPTFPTGRVSLPIVLVVVEPPPQRPATLDEAYALILRQHDELQSFKIKLRALEPDAENWRRLKEKNTESAKLPRRR